MATLQITNNGGDIVATNYWESEHAKRGLVYLSCNAGVIRLLLPPAREADIADMRAAETVVATRGVWQGHDAIEIMWDDGSESPYALHLTSGSVDLMPGRPDKGREWKISVWTRAGKQIAEQVCHWRRRPSLPCLEAWKP